MKYNEKTIYAEDIWEKIFATWYFWDPLQEALYITWGKCVDNAKNMTDKSEDNDIMLKELIEKYANDIVDACRLVLRISVMSSAWWRITGYL